MFETNPDEERGQVGIGTLIVFIALVLVAAIAAGVLINTAGFLQSQAEQTGQESTDQVANNVQLVTASGQASEADQNVDEIEFNIQLSPGSDPVRLMEDSDDDGTLDEVVAEVSVFGADLTFEEYDQELLGPDETATGSFDSADALDAGDDAEVVITTEDGSQTTFTLVAPDPISEDGDVRLS